MAIATVIHFGIDDCHRVQVMRYAGYDVRELDSLDSLRQDIEKDDTDGVIVSEVEPRCAEKAAVLVRRRSCAPLILFRRPGVVLDESRFDRVYDSLVPTAHWLHETSALVMKSKELRAASERLRHDSEHLRVELETMREESQRLLAEAAKELTRKLPQAWPKPDETDNKD